MENLFMAEANNNTTAGSEGKASETNTAQGNTNSEHKTTDQKTSGAEQNTASATATATATEQPKARTNYELAKDGELFANEGVPHRENIKNINEQISGADKKLGEANITQEAKDALNKNKDELSKTLATEKDSLKKILDPKFDEMKPFDRVKASVGGNFGKNASGTSKVFRGTGIVAGVGAMIDGTRRLFSPEVNEKTGEREGSAWGAVAEMGAGAGAVYLAAISGGRNKAMGI